MILEDNFVKVREILSNPLNLSHRASSLTARWELLSAITESSFQMDCYKPFEKIPNLLHYRDLGSSIRVAPNSQCDLKYTISLWN